MNAFAIVQFIPNTRNFHKPYCDKGFVKIIDVMPSFEKIEFGVDDIVRSPLVKEFVIAKHSLNL